MQTFRLVTTSAAGLVGLQGSPYLGGSRMNEAVSVTVKTRGLYLPPLAGYLCSLYLDTCPAGFCPAAVWRDRWRGAAGIVRTWGADAACVRFRLVIEGSRQHFGIGASGQHCP